MLKKLAGSVVVFSFAAVSLALFSNGCGGNDSGTATGGHGGGATGGTAGHGAGGAGLGGSTGLGGAADLLGGHVGSVGGSDGATGGAAGGAGGVSASGGAAGGSAGAAGGVGGEDQGGAAGGVSAVGGAAGGSAGAMGGSTGTAGAAGGSAGASGGAAGGAGGSTAANGGAGGGSCTNLALSGPQISKTTHAGPAPTMTGGLIADGTYLMTAIDKYNNTSGSNTHRETWVFSAGTFAVIGENSANNPPIQRASGTYTTTYPSGNTVTLTILCPSSGTQVSQYTVTGDNLQVLSDPTSSDQEIHTLTKQP